MLAIKCKECGSIFPLTKLEKDMSIEKVIMEDKTQIRVTRWTCPHCKKVYPVQLDNKKTDVIFQKLKSNIQALQDISVENKTRLTVGLPLIAEDVISSIEGEVAVLGEKLDDARNELRARYNRSFYQIEDRKEQLELCVPEHISLEEKEK